MTEQQGEEGLIFYGLLPKHWTGAPAQLRWLPRGAREEALQAAKLGDQILAIPRHAATESK